MTRSTTAFVAFLVVFNLCEIGYVAAMFRPRYVGCVDNAECAPGYCCVLGNNRYSIPACQPLLSVGDTCRPEKDVVTLNTTVHYPNGDAVILNNVYSTICNCGYGLSCDIREHVCKDRSHESGFNSLLEESSIQND